MLQICGDCLEVMAGMDENSVDSIVTDPPYGLSFMGKHWDHGVPGADFWREALRVAKPGAHMLAFGGTRTFHRLACAIEDAGWEIRDTLGWLYGSGFPKSLDVSKAIDKAAGAERKVVMTIKKKPSASSDCNEGWVRPWAEGKTTMDITAPATDAAKQWAGWGTALKPSHEPIICARKPLVGTVAANVLQYGTGALNIDKCRVWTDESTIRTCGPNSDHAGQFKNTQGSMRGSTQGRWPANLILSNDPEVLELFPVTKSGARKGHNKVNSMENSVSMGNGWQYTGNKCEASSGSAARFFYVAKSSRDDRNKGLNNYLTVKYIASKKGSAICEENMAAVQLLKRVMSDTVQMNFSIDESGASITAQCHKDFLSIILMETSKIIELKILNSLTHLLTSEFIQDANLETANGGNHAENAELLKAWMLTITSGNLELALGASNVALKMLLLINEKENWKQASNIHSTVKPTDLMRYLCRLVTPPGGVVLDPFMGSGSTGKAAVLEGFDFVGIDLEQEYCDIARARIEAAAAQTRLAI